jgi:hypothetical protein
MRMPLPILMAVTTRIGLGSIMLLLAACAAPPATHVLTGTARPPISPDEVRIYSQPPPVFEEVAMLTASSDSRLGSSAGGQAAIDLAIDRLKTEAAKLGANGVILQGISDRQTGSIGTGVGNESYSSHSAVGVGVGGSFGIYKKSAQGRAIYVPPNAQGFPLIPTAPLTPPPVPAPPPGSQVPPSGQ